MAIRNVFLFVALTLFFTACTQRRILAVEGSGKPITPSNPSQPLLPSPTVTPTPTPTMGASIPAKPLCTLSASHQSIVLGQSLNLTLATTGIVSSAEIILGGDPIPVAIPSGSIPITPPLAGIYSATGMIVGPGGANFCTASFEVTPSQVSTGGGASTPVVPIVSVSPAPTPPVDTAIRPFLPEVTDYVTYLYSRFYGRNPSAAELAFALDKILNQPTINLRSAVGSFISANDLPAATSDTILEMFDLIEFYDPLENLLITPILTNSAGKTFECKYSRIVDTANLTSAIPTKGMPHLKIKCLTFGEVRHYYKQTLLFDPVKLEPIREMKIVYTVQHSIYGWKLVPSTNLPKFGAYLYSGTLRTNAPGISHMKVNATFDPSIVLADPETRATEMFLREYN